MRDWRDTLREIAERQGIPVVEDKPVPPKTYYMINTKWRKKLERHTKAPQGSQRKGTSAPELDQG